MGDRKLDLSRQQREICLHLLRRVRELAEASGHRRFSRDIDPAPDRDSWNSSADDLSRLEPDRWIGPETLKPNGGAYHTFAISGGRGTGKSTLLQVFGQIAPRLGLSRAAPKAFDDLKKAPPWADFSEPHGSSPDSQRSALVLPIVDPSMFEDDGRTVMEQVLAHLQHGMTLALPSASDRPDDDVVRTWQEVAPRREQPGQRHVDQRVRFEERIKNLQHRLNKDIAPGWLYAQSIGQTMLVNDSASFNEYSQQRAGLSVVSALRHLRWRAFVNDLLATFNARIMIICFDDSDLNPSCTLDVLDAIRIYLKSELIMVVLATELATLEHNLTLKQLGNLASLRPAYAHAQALDGLERMDEIPLDKRPYSQVRHEIREAARFIEKIVPQPQRFQLDRIPDDRDIKHCEEILGRPARDKPPGISFLAPDEWLLRGSHVGLLATLTMRDLNHLNEAWEKFCQSEAAKEQREWSLLEAVVQFTSLQEKRDVLLDLYGHPGDLLVQIAQKSRESREIWVQQADEGVPLADVTRIGGIIRKYPSKSHLFSTSETSHNVDLNRYGRFSEFLVDRRRLDPLLAGYRIIIGSGSLSSREGRVLRPLPPVLIEDIRAIHGDQDSDVEHLVLRCRNMTDWPRNARFLSSAHLVISQQLLPVQAFDPSDFVGSAIGFLRFSESISRLLNTPLPESILPIISAIASMADPQSSPANSRALSSYREDLGLLALCIDVVIAPEGTAPELSREAFVQQLRRRPLQSLQEGRDIMRASRAISNLIEASSGIIRSFQLMLGALRCAEAVLHIPSSTAGKTNKSSEAITREGLLTTSDESLRDLIGQFEACINNLRENVESRLPRDVMEAKIDLLLAMVGPLEELRLYAGASWGQPIASALKLLVPQPDRIDSVGGLELSDGDKDSLELLQSCLRQLFERFSKDAARTKIRRTSLTLQSILRMPASVIEVALGRQ